MQVHTPALVWLAVGGQVAQQLGNARRLCGAEGGGREREKAGRWEMGQRGAVAYQYGSRAVTLTNEAKKVPKSQTPSGGIMAAACAGTASRAPSCSLTSFLYRLTSGLSSRSRKPARQTHSITNSSTCSIRMPGAGRETVAERGTRPRGGR